MTGRITNTGSVETAIREIAQERAASLFPQATMNEMGVLEQWAHEGVERVLATVAQPIGVSKTLSALDRVALNWLYVAAFSDEMQSRCEDEEEKRIDVLAAGVLCMHCAQPFLHANHGYHGQELASVTSRAVLDAAAAFDRGEADHTFACPHGDELLSPRDCITDHLTPHSH
jgi:hypothetical protein